MQALKSCLFSRPLCCIFKYNIKFPYDDESAQAFKKQFLNAGCGEDREFMDRLFRIINENISDAGITTSGIAGKMGMSLRNLYYRLDGLLTVTPSNIIKEYRIRYAARLLTTSSLSVDQIIDRCGFANRGTFFRNFSARYGTTPKVYRQTNSGIGSEQEAQ